jgi:hypothetical protein
MTLEEWTIGCTTVVSKLSAGWDDPKTENEPQKASLAASLGRQLGPRGMWSKTNTMLNKFASPGELWSGTNPSIERFQNENKNNKNNYQLSDS